MKRMGQTSLGEISVLHKVSSYFLELKEMNDDLDLLFIVPRLEVTVEFYSIEFLKFFQRVFDVLSFL